MDRSLYVGPTCRVSDTILWGNTAPLGPEVSLEWCKFDIEYCNVDGGMESISVGYMATLEWGDGMIDADPHFVDPWNGNFCLSQDPYQPGIVNPCVDAGSTYVLIHCMEDVWTRSDGVCDTGTVDLGFHYGPYTAPNLEAYPYAISSLTGGTVDFTLVNHEDNKYRYYCMLERKIHGGEKASLYEEDYLVTWLVLGDNGTMMKNQI